MNFFAKLERFYLKLLEQFLSFISSGKKFLKYNEHFLTYFFNCYLLKYIVNRNQNFYSKLTDCKNIIEGINLIMNV